MSHQQFAQTVQAEEEWAYEIQARRVEGANAEMSAARDDEFIEQLSAKYPQLRAWPGKAKA